MSNVVEFNGITRLDLDPDRVLKNVQGRFPEGVVVLGYDADGNFQLASSIADGPEVLWLLQLAIKDLMEKGSAE